jgi:serine/threonine-protein kinase TTK/MPS1
MGDCDITENYQNEIGLFQELRDTDRIVRLIDSKITDDADLGQIIPKQSTLSSNYIRYKWQQMLETVQTIIAVIICADRKPSIFLLVKGRLKLIDFGIAKVIH